METPLHEQLEKALRELLDLTARNRLLNTPFGRGRTTRLDIVDERSADLLRLLVQERREMTFLPSLSDDPEAALSESSAKSKSTAATSDRTFSVLNEVAEVVEGFQPDESVELAQPEESDTGLQNRYTDQHLQTQLSSGQLQLKLLRLSVEAKTIGEEQGINALFLALGFLEWYEAPNSDKPRFAPLVLVPIELHRKSASARFKVKALEDDLATNLSLQARLQADFRIQLPPLPDAEEFDVEAYFDSVEGVIVGQPRWQVHRNRITIWFFSFAKFLMFRDLSPEAWSEKNRLEDLPLVTAIMRDGFRSERSSFGDDEKLDSHFQPRDLIHVVDADSSQTIAIEEVRLGRNLVIQGPPGTGKSQTITNIIAAAVKDGEKILFVAEKMAALLVVKSRLDRVGLGDMCLELHSHKANKKSVSGELERTLNIGRPRSVNLDAQAMDLQTARDRLNRYAEELHAPIEPFGVTPFAMIGQLCRLKSENTQPLSVTLPQLDSWSVSTFNQKQQILREIALNLAELGPPKEHPFWGIDRDQPLLPSDVSNLTATLGLLSAALSEMNTQAKSLATQLRIGWVDETATPQTVQKMIKVTELLLAMPSLDQSCFANDVWTRQLEDIKRVVTAVRTLHQCQRETASLVAPVAWKSDLSQTRRQLAFHGSSWLRWFSGSYREARRGLRGLLTGPLPKGLDQQLQMIDLVMDGQQKSRELNIGSPLFQIGKDAFGAWWRGTDSDADALSAVVTWNDHCQKAALPGSFRKIVTRWQPSASVQNLLEPLRLQSDSIRELFTSVSETLEISLASVFGQSKFELVPLNTLANRIALWSQSCERINRWVVFRRRVRALKDAGLEPPEEFTDATCEDCADPGVNSEG